MALDRYLEQCLTFSRSRAFTFQDGEFRKTFRCHRVTIAHDTHLLGSTARVVVILCTSMASIFDELDPLMPIIGSLTAEDMREIGIHADPSEDSDAGQSSGVTQGKHKRIKGETDDANPCKKCCTKNKWGKPVFGFALSLHTKSGWCAGDGVTPGGPGQDFSFRASRVVFRSCKPASSAFTVRHVRVTVESFP